MKIRRSELLSELEAVIGGLARRDIIEQSDCFIFKNGKIYTDNDEILCCQPSILPFTTAVKAKVLLKHLHKMDDVYITVTQTEKGLKITGYEKEANPKADNEIILELPEIPDSRNPLASNFSEALHYVSHCFGQDDSQFGLTCVNVTPDYVETCDNQVAARYYLKTGITPFLFRGKQIPSIVKAEPTEFSETRNWVFYKNKEKLIIGVRRYEEEFPVLDEIFKTKKTIRLQWPKKLIDELRACKRQGHFQIRISKNRLMFTQTLFADSKEKKKKEKTIIYQSETSFKIQYDGKPFSFDVSPYVDLLQMIVLYGCEFFLNPEKSIIIAGNDKVIQVMKIWNFKSL